MRKLKVSVSFNVFLLNSTVSWLFSKHLIRGLYVWGNESFVKKLFVLLKRAIRILFEGGGGGLPLDAIVNLYLQTKCAY